jgi:3-oxoacyl-[acyl-carrier-protein] synthase-3
VSIGSYRPRRVVENDEVCALLDVDDEWVRRRSGIVSRRFAAADEDVVSMGVAAGRDALDRAGLSPSRVNAVVLATMSHLWQTPAAAPQIAERLGSKAAAFDANAACAGFCVALALGDSLVRSGAADYVLVIGSDKMTDIIDPRDRSTAFLFGDGAGAVVVGPGDAGIGPVAWSSDGAGSGLIAHSGSWRTLRDDPGAEWPTMRMAGREVADLARRPGSRVAHDADGRTGGLPMGDKRGPGDGARGVEVRRGGGRRPLGFCATPVQSPHHRRGREETGVAGARGDR